MEIIKIAGIGLATVIAMMILKNTKPEFAVLVSIAGGIVIVLMILNQLSFVFNIFDSITKKTGISQEIFNAILKIVGIGYLTEFAASICTDSGSVSIADKISLGGKIIILVISLPIITGIIDIVAGLIP